MQGEQLVRQLNHKKMSKRIKALKKLVTDGAIENAPEFPQENNINCNFKTIYSSTDRTPSLSVYLALRAGLPLVSVVDYASVDAGKEIIKACQITGAVYYIGTEVTVLGEEGNRITALALGIPHSALKKFNKELEPYRQMRFSYCKKFAEKLNSRLKKYGVKVSEEELTSAHNYCFAEEHIFMIVAQKLSQLFSTENQLLDFLTNELGYTLSEDEYKKLEDKTSTLYVADLCETIKSHTKLKLPEEKCKTLKEFKELCQKYGAISAVSIGGGQVEKAARLTKEAGVNAVVCDLDKIDQQEVLKLYDECLARGILPICRTVLDSPRKKFDYVFTDPVLSRNYRDCVMAIVGHEISTSINISDGMFSDSTLSSTPALLDRIKLYSRIGFKGSMI